MTTLSGLIERARNRVEDKDPNAYLWSDAEWTEYANWAEQQACRNARLLIDSTTASICEIDLNATDATYALDGRVIFIRRAKLSGVSLPLRAVSYKDIDRSNPGWEDETGEPVAYVKGMDTGQFRPYPSPNAVYTVTLTVCRLPLADMEDDTDEPEIHARFHDALIYGMLHRAYSKHDAETRDDKRAAEALAMFEREFGKASTAIDETWIEREHDYTMDEGVY